MSTPGAGNRRSPCPSVSSPARRAADRRREAGRICAYCGQATLSGRQRPEHPIPAALDSALVVYCVCDPCNDRAGTEVDQPWLDDILVRAARWRFDLRDPRHPERAPTHPIFDGVFTDEEGELVIARDGAPRYAGSIRDLGDRVQILAGSDTEADRLARRAVRHITAEGREVEEIRRRRLAPHRPWLTRTVSSRPGIGVRMGAKLGLALAGDTLGEPWRLSSHAEQLRGWLWADVPRDADGAAIGHVPSQARHPLASPPEHIAYFAPLRDELMLTVVIMGVIGFAVPIADASVSAPQRAWRAGRGVGATVVTTYDELLLRATRRATVGES